MATNNIKFVLNKNGIWQEKNVDVTTEMVRSGEDLHFDVDLFGYVKMRLTIKQVGEVVNCVVIDVLVDGEVVLTKTHDAKNVVEMICNLKEDFGDHFEHNSFSSLIDSIIYYMHNAFFLNAINLEKTDGK